MISILLEQIKQIIGYFRWLLFSFAICVGVLTSLGVGLNPAIFSMLCVYVVLILFVIIINYKSKTRKDLLPVEERSKEKRGNAQKKMKRPEILTKISKIIGVILFSSVLIIMLYFKLRYGIFSTSLIIIYSVYFIFVLFNLFIIQQFGRLVDKRIKESKELMHLRMNHSLTFSIFTISVSIPFIYEGVNNLDKWYVFIIGIMLIMIGVYFVIEYEVRFNRLEQSLLKRRESKL